MMGEKEDSAGNNNSTPGPSRRQQQRRQQQPLKGLSKKALKRFTAKQKAKGIVYLSRLPPNMKPQKVRQLLSEYGELGRVYLAAEDASVRRERKGKGKKEETAGKKAASGKRYVEGWVEFLDKKEAKIAAQLLNGEHMGGKKRSSTYYDLWCMKYLPKFEWDHLTEELNHQRAVLESKVAAEVAAANRERDFYLSRVDQAKAVESIIGRQQRRDAEGGVGGEGGGGKRRRKGPVRTMTFGQKGVIDKDRDKGGMSLGLLKRLAGGSPDAAFLNLTEL